MTDEALDEDMQLLFVFSAACFLLIRLCCGNQRVFWYGTARSHNYAKAGSLASRW